MDLVTHFTLLVKGFSVAPLINVVRRLGLDEVEDLDCLVDGAPSGDNFKVLEARLHAIEDLCHIPVEATLETNTHLVRQQTSLIFLPREGRPLDALRRHRHHASVLEFHVQGDLGAFEEWSNALKRSVEGSHLSSLAVELV